MSARIFPARVHIEPEGLPSDFQEVTVLQQVLALYPSTVDIGAVKTGVDQQKTLRSAQDVRMAAGNSLMVDRDVAGRLATESNRLSSDEMRCATREPYQPTQGGCCSGDCP